ncbi:MAG: histidine phosphatase family protein [Nannocystaceae bacterium]
MLLTLIRHGEACAPTAALGDRGRALTIYGREEARATGLALASRGLRPTAIWTSPLVRAVQTAELVGAALAYDRVIEARGDLFPSSEVESLCAALRGEPADASVIAVGHQPLMSTIAGHLLGIYVGGFATASAYHIALDRGAAAGGGALRWRWVGAFID